MTPRPVQSRSKAAEFVAMAARMACVAAGALDRLKLSKAKAGDRGRTNLRLRIKMLESRLQRGEADLRTYELAYECIAEARTLLHAYRDPVVRPLGGVLANLRTGWRFDAMARAIVERAVPGLDASPEMAAGEWRAPVETMEWAIIAHDLDLSLIRTDLADLGWWVSPDAYFAQGKLTGSLALLRTPPFATGWDIRRAKARLDAAESRRAKAKVQIVKPEIWTVMTALLSVAQPLGGLDA